MKKPDTPPNLKNKGLLTKLLEEIGVQLEIKKEIPVQVTYEGEYLHWDELQYKQPRPEGLSANAWWFMVKSLRRSLFFSNLPFKDLKGNPFQFVVPNNLLPKLANIDRKCGGITPNLAAYNQDRYLVNSLIEESISSSQLEGASTTRRIAKDMLLTQRKPRTNDELMILNNYRAMRFIRENKSRALSLDFILEIHRILTQDILEDAGQLRTHDDINVEDHFGEILHTPPKYTKLTERLKILCDFANQDETEEPHYIHPVIKAILLHFMLAYDHPFSDGNGRTARALFYWFMLNRGYWLMEHISISEVIKKAPTQYGRAFLYTETDDNDMTYFIFHQIKVILQAIDSLHKYIEEQNKEMQKIEGLLHNNNLSLNYRQLALIQHALKNSTTHYLIEHHKQSHNITYQTARTDLLKLEEWGLLIKRQIGKAFVFTVPPDLNKKIQKL